jgi:LPXTG-site transpeptidase (sortase) family protein
MVHAKKIDPFLFLVVTMWVFAASLFVLNAVGFVPYYVTGDAPTVSDTTKREYQTLPKTTSDSASLGRQQSTDGIPVQTPTNVNDPFLTPINSNLPSATMVEPEIPFLPEKILIPGLNKELPVVNPVSADVAVLDRELLDAVVRYPDSGLLNADGNMFIFGHSSHLRTVHNPMFKAFNGIETLPKGSLIQVIGGGRVFVYQVTKQEKVSADSALVDLTPIPGRRYLTLSTCNSFGEKSDRFVTTAEFSVSYPVK